ncbi:MAG: hypothetical protein K0R54_642 [Clostridiaceae bacterium]|nr:hypothetical protein [Clostridiaceae bacterium]
MLQVGSIPSTPTKFVAVVEWHTQMAKNHCFKQRESSNLSSDTLCQSDGMDYMADLESVVLKDLGVRIPSLILWEGSSKGRAWD